MCPDLPSRSEHWIQCCLSPSRVRRSQRKPETVDSVISLNLSLPICKLYFALFSWGVGGGGRNLTRCRTSHPLGFVPPASGPHVSTGHLDPPGPCSWRSLSTFPASLPQEQPPDLLHLKRPLSSQKDNHTREQNITENCLSKIDK